MEKHKVFISFKYTEDSYYKNKLVELSEHYDTFVDFSVGEGEISDTLEDNIIRQKIRDEFIKDATVTILLIGKDMNNSKFIDWEIHASMFNSEKNPKMGIVCINLPYINDAMLDCENVIKTNTQLPNLIWTPIERTKEAQRKKHPNAPERIIENIIRNEVNIPIINWDTLFYNGDEEASNLLQKLVDYSFNIRNKQNYDTSTPLRRRHS